MNVSPEADEVLRAGGVDGSHKGARVLDLHTSCGKWVQEMTKIYPNATFVSVDIKPLVAHMPHANVSFEVYDLYAGIAEPSSSFDVVHARQCVTLTKDFNLLLREMHRVLKPNGILVITEIPIQAYEVDRPYELLHSAPRQAAGLRLVRKGLVSQGIDINAWDEMTARLKPDHLLWAERTFNAEAGIVESRSCSQHTRGFHCIKLSTRLVPSGSWHENETQQMIGCLARSLFIDTWDALVPLMLMMGMDEAEARAVVDGALEELVGGKAEAYLKCHRWTAMKL
ncbi:hypothetical protein FRC08_009636 [Ceratobasidium sp. 394]|nr:hypothetical protein FRC08_009636 [Ceratobasidium sp. 394]